MLIAASFEQYAPRIIFTFSRVERLSIKTSSDIIPPCGWNKYFHKEEIE
jgi:hypothetical protein